MDLQGGSLNFLQGGGGISLQGSSPRLQSAPNTGISIQPAASGNIVLDPNTRFNAPAAATPASQNQYYGGGNTTATAAAPAAPVYPDKSGDIGVNQAGLDATGTTRDTAVGLLDKSLSTVMGQYGDDLSHAATSYNNETNANETDLQGNKQSSLEHAVQGRQGLYGTLASLGALSGTGVELANHAVQKGANEDLTTAANTYATNQNGLDSGYGTYKQNEERLKEKAQTAHDNNVQQAQNDFYKNQQTYLKNIADDYTAEGKPGQAKTYQDKVSALFPQIASTNVPTIDMGYTGSAYTAPTLQSYVGAANNTSVATRPAPAGSALAIPGLLAYNKKQA